MPRFGNTMLLAGTSALILGATSVANAQSDDSRRCLEQLVDVQTALLDADIPADRQQEMTRRLEEARKAAENDDAQTCQTIVGDIEGSMEQQQAEGTAPAREVPGQAAENVVDKPSEQAAQTEAAQGGDAAGNQATGETKSQAAASDGSQSDQATQQGGAEIVVRQPEPEVTVKQGRPTISVEQQQPIITIHQPQPEITINMPEPTITVEMPAPIVRVQQPRPEVAVEQRQPQVQVSQDKPDVQVQQAAGQPNVKVDQQSEQPDIQLTTNEEGQPKVNYQQEDPKVTVNRADPKIEFKQEEPKVEVSQVDASRQQGGDAAQRQSAMAQADQQPRAGEQSTTQEQTTQQPPAMVTADPAETPAGPDQQSTTGQPPAQTAQTTSTEQPRSTEAPTQQAAGDVEQRREQERVLVERAEVGTPADFVGYEVYNAQGEQIGDVDYAVRSRSDDQIYLVVGFSGFLGIGEKLAAVPLSEFQLTPDSRLALPNETEDTLDARPEYTEEEFIALE